MDGRRDEVFVEVKNIEKKAQSTGSAVSWQGQAVRTRQELDVIGSPSSHWVAWPGRGTNKWLSLSPPTWAVTLSTDTRRKPSRCCWARSSLYPRCVCFPPRSPSFLRITKSYACPTEDAFLSDSWALSCLASHHTVTDNTYVHGKYIAEIVLPCRIQAVSRGMKICIQ